jgi:fermentation-respiration switch protein FrsA (DUF1100 family)
MLNRQTLKSWLHYLFIGELSLRRLVHSAILIPIVSVFGLLDYGYMFTDRIIFQPPPPSYVDSEQIIKLTAADGAKISAIYLPNDSASYTILFSHGNAEDLGTVKYKLHELNSVGFSVLGYDYHGYGTSEGRPTEKGVYQDIDAAYEYLTKQLKIAPDRIILHGLSLGGAVAADLASRKPVGGLILESTFVSAFRVVTAVPMPFDQFKTLSKLKNITCPVLIIHGRADSVVKFWHGEMLYENANEPKQFLWADNAGHGDVSYIVSEQYEQALKNFVGLTKTQSLR